MRWLNVLVVAVAGALFCSTSFAADAQPASKGDTKHAKKAEEKSDGKKTKQTWAVIKVGDALKVVPDEKAAQMKKDYEKEAKDAAKGKKAKKPDPKKAVTLVKGGFATEKEAEKHKEDLEKQEKAKKDTAAKAATTKGGGKK